MTTVNQLIRSFLVTLIAVLHPIGYLPVTAELNQKTRNKLANEVYYRLS
jgi:hypothetical protein